MDTLLLLLVFIFGTAVGSFLNVVAYRSIHGGSIVFDTSACPACKHKLVPLDLIPVVSFLLLAGKCRYCRKKISIQYPLVETATGVLFLLSFFYWSQVGFLGNSLLSLAYLLFITSVFIVLFVTDLKDGLLPNSIVISSIAAAAVFKLLFALFGYMSPTQLGVDLLTALVIGLIFFLIVYVSREKAMGGGDIKLVFLIGLAVGWPAILVGLFAGFLTGAFVAVMLLLIGKKRFGETIPLGPFLTIGGFISLFWGQEILSLYLKLIST